MTNNEILNEFNLNESKLNQLEQYKNLLQEWSKKMNLTSITEDTEVYIKHFYDSLVLEKYLNKNIHLADVGTGAGFPGLPIKIAREDLIVDLIEPTTKRCIFLSQVVNELKLENVNIINKRSEDLPDKLGFYDAITSRAVASLNILLELSIPLLKVGGKMYALKGSSFDEEIKESKNALKELKCKVINIYEFDLPLDLGHRAIIEIEKYAETSKKYPRVYAKIKKQPL
jgi:16S rRNA (guanine527-N7)-methyltransferase